MFKKKDSSPSGYNQRIRTIIHAIMAQVPDTSLIEKAPLYMTTMKKGTTELTIIHLEDNQIVYKITPGKNPFFHQKTGFKESYWKIGSLHTIIKEFKNSSG